MAGIGIIGGSAVLNHDLFPDARTTGIKTEYGQVDVLDDGRMLFLQRHGKGVPPHMINHRANIQAMKQQGFKHIIAISSCGSLKKDIRPGDLVVIDDYMQLSGIPSFFDDKIIFATPGISSILRKKIIEAAIKLKIEVHEKGTYIQTKGPRYETRAEIRMFKSFADVVGMTIASEAALANEAGIEYAAVCSADNYAHGLDDSKITSDKIAQNQKKNHQKIMQLISEVVEGSS